MTDDTGTLNSSEPKLDLDEWARCLYERAQDSAHHSDSVIFEVAAIVWGANTLLLGFILEVPGTPHRQGLVALAAFIGIVLSAYVPWVLWLSKKGHRMALEFIRDVEERLPPELQLHTQIHARYPAKRGTYAIWMVTVAFFLVWCIVLFRALLIMLCSN